MIKAVLFEDDEKNVHIAQSLGIHACYFSQLEDIDEFLTNIKSH